MQLDPPPHFFLNSPQDYLLPEALERTLSYVIAGPSTDSLVTAEVNVFQTPDVASAIPGFIFIYNPVINICIRQLWPFMSSFKRTERKCITSLSDITYTQEGT